MLSNILLSKLTPHAEGIIQYHQCGFQCNRSTTEHKLCIRQILEKQWEHNEAVHQLFIDFKKTYDSVRREVLYNTLNEFGIPMKLVRLTKMCLNDTYSRVQVGKHLSDVCPIRNALKQGEVLSLLLFNYLLEQHFSNFFQVGTTFISQNVLRTTLLLGLSNSLGLP